MAPSSTTPATPPKNRVPSIPPTPTLTLSPSRTRITNFVDLLTPLPGLNLPVLTSSRKPMQAPTRANVTHSTVASSSSHRMQTPILPTLTSSRSLKTSGQPHTPLKPTAVSTREAKKARTITQKVKCFIHLALSSLFTTA